MAEVSSVTAHPCAHVKLEFFDGCLFFKLVRVWPYPDEESIPDEVLSNVVDFFQDYMRANAGRFPNLRPSRFAEVRRHVLEYHRALFERGEVGFALEISFHGMTWI